MEVGGKESCDWLVMSAKGNGGTSHVFADPELEGRINPKFQPMWWKE